LLDAPRRGSLVGYTTAAVLVQSGLLGMGPNNLVAKETERRELIEASCRQAIARMAECRIAAESLIASHAREYEGTLIPALNALEANVVEGNAASAIEALAAINASIGDVFPLRDFRDFDRFMQDPGKTLVL